jgi:hypothetical protein
MTNIRQYDKKYIHLYPLLSWLQALALSPSPRVGVHCTSARRIGQTDRQGTIFKCEWLVQAIWCIIQSVRKS